MKRIFYKNQQELIEMLGTTPFGEQTVVEFCKEGNSYISLTIKCYDDTISLSAHTKDGAYVTEQLEIKTGESLPIDEIIKWFKNQSV